MGPVLEQVPLRLERLELIRRIAFQARPEDQMVGPLHHVDGIHLHIAQLIQQPLEPARGRGAQEGLTRQQQAPGLEGRHGLRMVGHPISLMR